MAVPHVADTQDPHTPLECHGCAVLTLIDLRSRLDELRGRLTAMDGPGDVDEALRAILKTLPSYTQRVREEPASLEDNTP